jgi:HD-GYP domain-containing protein (c-di-GMP phosphodiesterase class II)
MSDKIKKAGLIGDVVLFPREELLAALHGMVQTVRIHQENNELVVNVVRRFLKVVYELLEDSEDLTIQWSKGRFYVQEEKVVHRRESSNLVDNMLKFFEKRGLMGLRIYPVIADTTLEDIVKFSRFLNDAVRYKNPMDWLVLKLEEEKIEWVAALQPEVTESANAASGLKVGRGGKGGGSGGDGSGEGGSGDEVQSGTDDHGQVGSSESSKVEVPGQRSPRKVYAYALESMKEVADKISGNQRAGVRNAVRIVHNMVEEVVLQEQPLLLAMSTIRVYDDYTFSHSANVAILSMYLGKKIGVSKETMECLGICGLFHDLGKVIIPQEILNKKDPLTEEEFKEIRKHSLNSSRLILRLRASASRKARIILAPFEHHLKFDLTGYPDIGWKKPISLPGRILAVCDVYDALTSPRIYRKEPMSADKALGIMLEGSGTIFDPLLLKVFINMLGVYPMGTLLELDTGEIGLASRSPSTHVMNRPWVLLLQPDGQGGFEKDEEVNLADKDSSGYYYRSVTGSVNPAVFNIQPAEFLSV